MSPWGMSSPRIFGGVFLSLGWMRIYLGVGSWFGASKSGGSCGGRGSGGNSIGAVW